MISESSIFLALSGTSKRQLVCRQKPSKGFRVRPKAKSQRWVAVSQVFNLSESQCSHL